MEWTFKIGDTISFFDVNCSYELTGYRPINKTEGLDFNPSWFTSARDNKIKSKKYCDYPVGSKKYKLFWKEEYRRCRDGMTSHGYTITGWHYFFLNYFTLPLVIDSDKLGTGRSYGFPNFFVAQYEYFHYIELCKKTKRHACLLKARGVGFTEVNAAQLACEYSVKKESISLYTCADKGKLSRGLSKVWHELSYLDTETESGMRKLRQLSDTATLKVSGHYEMIEGQRVAAGWQSRIEGVTVDDPQKLRGDRVDTLVMDEGGSWPDLVKTYIQGQALVTVQGITFGFIIVGGTGGDKGVNVEGLRSLYYNPQSYNILPYRHHFTADGNMALTGFFIPAFKLSLVKSLQDKRGYCDEEAVKKYLSDCRDSYKSVPKAYTTYCAEYCWTAEEAFSIEGENDFDREALLDQLTAVRLHPEEHQTFKGNLSYIRREGDDKLPQVIGYKWENNLRGAIEISEFPVWSQEYELYNKQKRVNPVDGLYVIGVDGIDIGAAQTSAFHDSPSDFCVVVLKRAIGMSEPKLVCLYKERPSEIRTAYKTAMCICQYYNGKINLEATRMGFLTWAKQAGFTNFFMRRPQSTIAPGVLGGRQRSFGTPATSAIISMQLELIANFIVDYCHNIDIERILDELLRYSRDKATKFDIVAALGMAMIANEEMVHIIPKANVEQESKFPAIGFYIDSYGHKRFGKIPNAY